MGCPQHTAVPGNLQGSADITMSSIVRPEVLDGPRSYGGQNSSLQTPDTRNVYHDVDSEDSKLFEWIMTLDPNPVAYDS